MNKDSDKSLIAVTHCAGFFGDPGVRIDDLNKNRDFIVFRLNEGIKELMPYVSYQLSVREVKALIKILQNSLAEQEELANKGNDNEK